MPSYLYQVIREDGSEGEMIEFFHPMDEPLVNHPETGEKLKRIYTSPNLATRYTPGNTKTILSNDNLADKGFTKYEKDKLTGKYNKIVGDGPSTIERPAD